MPTMFVFLREVVVARAFLTAFHGCSLRFRQLGQGAGLFCFSLGRRRFLRNPGQLFQPCRPGFELGDCYAQLILKPAARQPPFKGVIIWVGSRDRLGTRRPRKRTEIVTPHSKKERNPRPLQGGDEDRNNVNATGDVSSPNVYLQDPVSFSMSPSAACNGNFTCLFRNLAAQSLQPPLASRWSSSHVHAGRLPPAVFSRGDRSAQ